MPTRHLTHKKCESYALTLFWIHPGIQILPGYAYQKSKGRMKHVKTRIRNLYAGYDTLLVKFRLEGDSIVDMQTAPVTDYPIQETYRCSLVYSQENEGLFWTTDHGKLMWIDPSDMDNLKIAEVGTIGGTANSAGWAYNTCMFEIPQREPVIPYAQPTGDTIEPLTSENRRNAFVVDDSIYERKGSKKAELLAKVYDHASHRYTRGFRMLTLGWSDGVTFLPVNSCLLSSEKESSRINESCEVDSNSNGAKARKFAVKKATEVIPELISEAMEAGIRANYVLFDSWFSSPKVIRSMKELGLDVVAMVKKSSKIHYGFQGQMCSCKDIFRSCKHRRGRSRYLLSVPVEICGGDEDAAPIAAKLVFVRNRSNRKDYLVLLSTDTSLTEDEVIALYGKRWDIEVFFKTCKSVLKLKKECRSLSYDAMCAQTAIVLTRYMFLAVDVRKDSDLRSSGPLFCPAADELADIFFAAAFEKLQLFLQKLLERFYYPERGNLRARCGFPCGFA